MEEKENMNESRTEYSWKLYSLDDHTLSQYRALIQNERENLLETFRQTRDENAKIGDLIKLSLSLAKEKRLPNIERLFNSLWFILQRDTHIKIKCEQLIENEDDDRGLRSAIEACGLIYEILQKIEAIVGGSFNAAARECGVDESLLKLLNVAKKEIREFEKIHVKSLKHVRNTQSSHFDTDHEICMDIQENLGRQEITSMLVDFGKRMNTLARAMQNVANDSISKLAERQGVQKSLKK